MTKLWILLLTILVVNGAEKPNIILILTDDQGWGTTSVQMDENIPESASDFIQTPNLKKLAARGVRFSNGYAPHPNCSPSRYSIQTGKSPALLQMTDIVGRNSGRYYEGNRIIPPAHVNAIDDKEITIAELIIKHCPDYSTAHFGKWHLKGGGPEKHGYGRSDGDTGNREGTPKDKTDPKLLFGLASRANYFMTQHVEEDKPFFMQISHYATHLGIQYRPETLKIVESRPAAKRHTENGYAAMVEDLDTSIGMVLDKVKELGIEKNTYVIFLADNGTFPLPSKENLNGPLHGWKATVWEGGIRVPFLIAGPGIKPGQSNIRAVGYDLFPTICDWLNIKERPKGIEGGSLIPALTGKAVARPKDYLVFHFPHYQLDKGSQPATAIYYENYKMLHFWETGKAQIYNLDKDISEATDLASSMPERVSDLKKKMMDYLTEINAGMPAVNKNFSPEKDPGKSFLSLKEKLRTEPYPLVPEKKKIKKKKKK